MEDNKIILKDENGAEAVFYILEETKVNGVSYVMVTETEDDGEDDIDVYIMKDVSDAASDEAIYEFVEDDDELMAVADVFEELMDEDTDLVK